jgi:hypothetical protein
MNRQITQPAIQIGLQAQRSVKPGLWVEADEHHLMCVSCRAVVLFGGRLSLAAFACEVLRRSRAWQDRGGGYHTSGKQMATRRFELGSDLVKHRLLKLV